MSNWTEAKARQAIMNKARSQLGYNSGKTYSKYGEWYGWPAALWCACFASWCYYQTLGNTAAKLVIGAESTAPYGRGYVWTVAWNNWLAANGKKVSMKNAKPGDIVMFKYPTGDSRNTNPVNHVDLVESNHYSAGYITTIGGNTPKPGTVGDPSNGRGVWRHNRSIYDKYIVAIYSPRWSALVFEEPIEVIYELTKPIISMLNDLGYQGTTAGVKEFQKKVGLVADGIPGPLTQKRLEVEMTKALDELTAIKNLINAQNKVLDAQTKQINYNRDRLEGLKQQIAAIKFPSIPEVKVNVKEIADATATAVWRYRNKAITNVDAYTHLRGGRVDNPNHKAYPADQGSSFALLSDAVSGVKKILGTKNAPHDSE